MNAVVTQAAELMPCPFCSAGARTHEAFPEHGVPWVVKIEHGLECPMVGWEGYCYPTEAEAITAWNTRHRSEATEELLSEYQRAVEHLRSWLDLHPMDATTETHAILHCAELLCAKHRGDA